MESRTKYAEKLEIARKPDTRLPRDLEDYYFQLLAANAQDILWVLEPSFCFSYISPSITRITGYTVEEALHLVPEKTVVPASYEAVMRRFHEVLKDTSPTGSGASKRLSAEVELIRKDGSTFWGEIEATLVRDEHGDLMKIIGITRDISERKASESALQKTVSKLREFEAIVRRSPAVVFLWRVTDGWPVEFVSDGVSQFGYTPDDFTSGRVSWVSVTHPEDVSRLEAEVADYTRRGIKQFTKNYRIISRSGDIRWIEDHTIAIEDSSGTLTHYQGIILDVTDRKTAEDLLRANEEMYRTLVENAQEGIWMIDTEYRTMFVNQRMADMLGYSVEEIVNRPVTAFMDDAALTVFQRNVKLRRQGITDHYDFELMRKDGTRVYVMAVVSLLFDQRKSYRGTIAFVLDVTKRRQMEEALRDSEERFRGAFENAATGMALVGIDGRFLLVNRTLCRMLGYRQDELLGMMFRSVTCPEEGKDSGTDKMQELLNTRNGFIQLEQRYLHKQGHLIWVLAGSTLVRDAQGAPLYFIIQLLDITDRKVAEEKIRLYQRQLRSLASRLSLTEEKERRRIATDLHDHIGQMLAVSKIKLGQVNEMLEKAGMGHVVEDVRELIEQALHYTRSLTGKLSPPILYELGFEAAVDWLLSETARNHGIEVRFEKHSEPRPLPEDIRIALFQGVRELLTNVIKHAQARHVTVCTVHTDRQIEVKIEDDGIGFDPAETMLNAHRKHAFGLFHLRERLEHLGGSFDVESKPGCGTRITLIAPLTEE